MQTREQNQDNPLRHLTRAQFMALGGNAVVYVKQIKGDQLAQLMSEDDLPQDCEFHIVVSADGSPLMVADTQDAVSDWLSERNFGIVALH